MNEFSRRSCTISYVDNLELLARSLGALQQGIITMQTWSDIWKLDLDAEKSYIWSTEAHTRKEAQLMGWKIEQAAKDLGAQMNYGKKGQVSAQTQRIQSLDGVWPKLKRCCAPSWKKQQLLRQAIWPKAFYGIATCTLGWNHIKLMRTEAMKALGFHQQGLLPGFACRSFATNSATLASFKSGACYLHSDALLIKGPSLLTCGKVTWRSSMEMQSKVPSPSFSRFAPSYGGPWMHRCCWTTRASL